jgi:hypothetical protein
MAEPSSPLWTAVKSIYDAWPPDDETVAGQLGDGWRRGAGHWTQAALGSVQAGNEARAGWDDQGGAAFSGKVREHAEVMDRLQQEMRIAAGRGDSYAGELASAKAHITDTITSNESVYTLLGNPLFGELGPALQDLFAGQIATNLRAMITAKAQALSSPPPPPPPPPARAPTEAAPKKDDGWSAMDWVHTALDVAGLVPVVGEVFDGVNAGLYLSEGDYLNAGLSAAAMIPVAGWLATGGKLGYKAVNSGLAFKAVNNLDTALNFAKNRPPGVPLRAKSLPFTADENFSTGLKYQWREPVAMGKDAPPTTQKVTYTAHGIDPRRTWDQLDPSAEIKAENAGQGPTHRVKVGNKQYADAGGDLHHSKTFNDNSPNYDEAAVNDTHLPYPSTRYPAPDQTFTRIFVPNVAALGPNGEHDK